MTPPFRVEVLTKQHDRTAFACGPGKEALERYFKTQVSQDVARRIAHCFVAVDVATNEVTAYYTISTASIQLDELPPELTKKMPRYPTVPAMLIGRLAVDMRFQKKGLGAGLLADATTKALQSPPAIYALLVDAIDDEAAAFYEHHGFVQLKDRPRALFLPVATAQKALLESNA